MNKTQLAQDLYTAYCAPTAFKSVITGADLPQFENCPPKVQAAWGAVADHLINSLDAMAINIVLNACGDAEYFAEIEDDLGKGMNIGERLNLDGHFQKIRITAADILKLEPASTGVPALSMDRERRLNLLAVIHRDGGHYVAEHGLEQAVKDAMSKVLDRMPTDENYSNIRPEKDGYYWAKLPHPDPHSYLTQEPRMVQVYHEPGRYEVITVLLFGIPYDFNLKDPIFDQVQWAPVYRDSKETP